MPPLVRPQQAAPNFRRQGQHGTQGLRRQSSIHAGTARGARNDWNVPAAACSSTGGRLRALTGCIEPQRESAPGSGGGTGPLAGVPHTQPGPSGGQCAGAEGAAGSSEEGDAVGDADAAGSELTEVGRGSTPAPAIALFMASTKLSPPAPQSMEARREGAPESAPEEHMLIE